MWGKAMVGNFQMNQQQVSCPQSGAGGERPPHYRAHGICASRVFITGPPPGGHILLESGLGNR